MDILPFPLPSAGWSGLLLEIFAMMVGGWYILRRNRSQYEEAAQKAQNSAVDAMRLESDSLRRRVEDVERENDRLNHIIEAIYTALKAKKILINIMGETVEVHMEEEKIDT